MTTILIVVIFVVVGVAAAFALFDMNKKSSGDCKDHSGSCGCGSKPAAGGGATSGTAGDSAPGGGDGGGD